MKNHGLIRVDKTFLMQLRMEQEKREKEEQEKKDKLKTKLTKYGFNVLSEGTSSLKLIVSDFYYEEYSFEVEAYPDDCDYDWYTLWAYEYGVSVDLVSRGRDTITVCDEGRAKEESIEAVDIYNDCTEYDIDDPILLGGYFFDEKATEIAKKTANKVANGKM